MTPPHTRAAGTTGATGTTGTAVTRRAALATRARTTGTTRVRVAALALAALAASFLLPAGPASAASPGPTVYQAAPTGSGDACDRAHPCSLDGARAKVRAGIAGGMDRDVRVELRGGVYPMTGPLTLGAADSGRDGHTVTWTAAPGAHPVLSGGDVLGGWARNPDGTWTAAVPAGVTPRQLFVDGQRAIPARGAACAASVCHATKDGLTGAVATGIAGWARPADVTAVIKVRWRNYQCRVTGVSGDVLTFAQPCWADSSSGTGRTGPSWDTTTVDSTRYTGVAWFQNAPELLDTPGEFVWNSAARTVTYLPRAGQDMRQAQAVTPATEHLVVVDHAHDLDLTGLGFAYAAYLQPGTPDGYAGTQAGLTLTGASGPADQSGRYYTKPSAALTVDGGRNVHVENADFTHLGGAGAVLQDGTQHSSVTRSRFTDLSSGALYVGDTDPHPSPELAGRDNTVAYDTIDHAGVEYTDAAGIWAGYEADLTVDHNTLEHLPYSGVSVGWGWNQPGAQTSVLRDNRITANRITDVMRVQDGQHDGGAVYTQGDQPGTVISGNYINRSAYGNTERDGNGIYLDEQSSHITVENNVLTRLGYKWISNWADYGVQNTATGNWTDTDAPALAGTGSVAVGNHTRLDVLPAPALAIAARAGADGPHVEPLRADLARQGTATQSSTDGTATAANAADGDTTTDALTLSAAGSWWQTDLGAVHRIDRIEIWNDAAMTTADADVSISDSPDFARATTVHLTGKALRPTVLDHLGARGRYVRITATGTGRIGLAEVRVHS
ncbi:beta-glucuronidase [Actinacidiphila yanglinensis]|uniref:Beta-glucuronidase n=1 Tax=Actinacidiphila yanglinensis TaxID=310779 RepID=A0A1H6CS84_9ACTN|nr:right-handed parallel beta-helix repeat-containing protein [Actinacidiphila yanglinensis]SEG75882.1 beta-glucuronidase [Actinacidiphila yanglinensis]